MKYLLLPLFLVISFAASAGTLYRCGNTFSQIPCGNNAQAVQVQGGEVGKSAVSPEQAKHVCVNDLRKWVPFPDPDNLKIESMSRGTPEIIEYAGTKLMARRYELRVNLANAAPGRNYSCFVSEDNQRILKISASGG